MDKGKLVFDTNILEDGCIVNAPLLETRLDALVKEMEKCKNAEVHILLLNDFVTIREENIPSQLTPSEVRDYLELPISQSIRISIENPKFDFGIIEKNEYEQKIFIIAYSDDAVNLYQNILQNVSLKPTVADVSALSLYRVANRRGTIKKDKDHHTLLLEWNPYDLSIMVFH
ncbi:pilus assembly protein PilM [Carnobacteriaceae bacterium 52-44]